MQAIDTTLFLWLTGSLQSPGWLIALAKFLASDIAPLVGVAFVIGWVRARAGWRPVLLDAVAAAMLGLVAVQVIGLLHYRPRPFEAGLGANLLNHLPENSFPSDHATLMFALAISLLSGVLLYRAGSVLLLLAVGVSWGRVFLGVHYPSDMLGGAVLAGLCVAVVRSVDVRLKYWALFEAFYEAILGRLHMPQAIFPRGR